MKKLFALALVFAMLITMVGCGSGASSNETQSNTEENTPATETVYTIKYAHTCADNHAYQQLGVKFKELVEAESGGRLKVELYPSSQLGGETDLMEGIQAGTVEMTTVSLGVGANFIDGINLFSLPFLFNSVEHSQKVVFGEIGQKIVEHVDCQNGLKVCGLWGSVFRVPFSAVGPLTTVDDFKGVKIRLMEVPLHMDTYAALGANPTTLAMSEVYMGLQTGTVDAAENAVSSIYSQKFYEVAHDVTMVPVLYNGCVTVFSQKFFDSLPEDLQTICMDAVAEAMKYADDYYVAAEDSARAEMEAAGTVFHEVSDTTPFIEATASVREAAAKDISDWALELLPEIEALG